MAQAVRKGVAYCGRGSPEGAWQGAGSLDSEKHPTCALLGRRVGSEIRPTSKRARSTRSPTKDAANLVPGKMANRKENEAAMGMQRADADAGTITGVAKRRVRQDGTQRGKHSREARPFLWSANGKRDAGTGGRRDIQTPELSDDQG